jgi:phosphoribosyl-ATP pyrophosphohydrolase
MEDDTQIGVCPPDCICIVCVTDRRRRLPRRETPFDTFWHSPNCGCQSCLPDSHGAGKPWNLCDYSPASVALDAAWMDRKAAWSRETFGPVNMPTDRMRIANHIDSEIGEIFDAIDDDDPEALNVECADVILLALDMMHRNGLTGAEIIATITGKQETNTRRTWPDWRTADPTMPMEHVKGDGHGE